MPKCSISHYLFTVFVRSMAIGIVAWMISNYIHSFFSDTFLTVILTSLISIVIFSVLVFSFGLSAIERSAIKRKLGLVFHRIYK